MNISGILMAGGQSMRMNKDKGFVLFKGKPMALHGIDLLKNHFSDCKISTNSHDYAVFKLPLIPDIHKNIGPMGGLHASLSTIKNDYIFLLGCDLPNIISALILQLLEQLEDYDIVLPVHNPNQLEPLCGIYSRRLLKRIEQMIIDHNFKMHDLITSSHTGYVNVDNIIEENPDLFDNINTPEQLK